MTRVDVEASREGEKKQKESNNSRYDMELISLGVREVCEGREFGERFCRSARSLGVFESGSGESGGDTGAELGETSSSVCARN